MTAWKECSRIMLRLRLIVWNESEAGERAAALEAAGFDVIAGPLDAAGLRAMQAEPPDAVVIDLARLPAQGRDVALHLRKTRGTRHVPLVFVKGDKSKTARLMELIPDAVYTTWSRIGGSVKKAVAAAPADPVVLPSLFDIYSGTPLPKKLGIKTGMTVALAGAPPDFESTLGNLPEGVTLRRRARGSCDMVIWFTRSLADLRRRVAKMGALAGRGGLWIVWPKKASGVESDLSQNRVREIGLAAGLVDFQVCAVDATWSGLRFTRRKPEA